MGFGDSVVKGLDLFVNFSAHLGVLIGRQQKDQLAI
jgi:hypothetical protein